MDKLKSLIVTLTLLAPTAISARNYSVEEARDIATSFIKKDNLSRSTASTKTKLTLATQGGSRSTAAEYYIFNVSDDNGYVIVSGDDRFNEILGYADSGNYESAKSNAAFDFWLSCMKQEMSAIPDKKNTDTHLSRGSLVMTEVAPLLTTTWGQNAPYNNDCWVGSYRPTIGYESQHAPTGCVATAMAQVMNYHKWPQSYNDFEYKWDLMLPSYDGSESAKSIDQVAKLMSHCGKSVNMTYGSSASGASDILILSALVKDFGYDSEKIQRLNRNSYGYEQIHSILNTELKEGRPVIVGGDYPGISMGHEFIFDGCTSDGFFHVNWGWSGYLDGYFRLTSLRPEDYGTGGTQEGYSFNVSLFVGIQPQKNIVDEVSLLPKIVASGDLLWVYEEGRDTVTTKYYSYMEPYFKTENGLPHNGFTNVGAASFIGYDDIIQTKWTNLSTGEVTIKGGKYFVRGIKSGYYTEDISFFNNGFSIDLRPDEKYEVSLVYHLSNDAEGVYHDVEFDTGRRSSVIVERFGDSLRYIYPKTPVLLKADIPTLSDRLQIKSNQNFSVNFTNTSDTEYIGAVKCLFKDSEGNILNNLTDYVMLDLLPGEKITEDLTLYNLGKATPGTYTVGIYDYCNNLISEAKTVELYEYVLAVDETNFPDPVFRDYINSKYDLDNNGILSSSELNKANTIQVNGLGIADFKGCELLPNLSFVEIIQEKCTAIDLSTCGPFNYLSIQDTPLETITLGNRKELMYFTIYNTALKEIDLTGCPKVTSPYLVRNKLEKLLIRGLSNIQSISCGENNLTELDLTGLTKLTQLKCSSNNLTTIDLTAHTNLTALEVAKNKFSGKFDLSNFNQLKSLSVWGNEITELVLGDHPDLKSLDASDNKLTGKIDVSGYGLLESCDVSNNNLDEFILSEKNKAITYLRLSNNRLKGLLDVTSLENLENLYAENNSLEEVLLKKHANLKNISLSNNKLTGKIDLSSCTKLSSIYAYNNELSELVFGSHPDLETISVSNNRLEGQIDLSHCPVIRKLYLDNNQLQEIILSNHPELEILYMDMNPLIAGTLDISGSPKLQSLHASGSNIAYFKYAQHPYLKTIYIDNNCLTHFHVEDFEALISNSHHGQKANLTIGTPNLNLKTISSTGFDPKRASDWWIYWNDGTESKHQEASTINDVLIIPEEAGREVTLEYKYLTDVTTNRKTNFTINLTREGITAIDDITADSTDEITVEGNTIHTTPDCMKEIFNISGQCIYRGTDESISIDSGRGIYLIRIAGKTFKVII